MSGKRIVRMTVNGSAVEEAVEPRLLLSDFLRQVLGLTGTHVGCEHGVCGACTIRLDGRTARACLTFAVQAEGREIVTVEGLGAADAEHHALQCGFCTPGMLMAALEILETRPGASEAEIREGLSGNLCRCTGYEHIVAAVRAAAERLAEAEKETPP
jgi:carbon-monoxide dehydrogenase small subunit